jgi:hypothetical protein
VAKPPKQKGAAEFARRRAGGSSISTAAAALQRFNQLADAFDKVPESYKGMLMH